MATTLRACISRATPCIIALWIMVGCDRGAVQQTVPPQAIRGLLVEMTVKQRSTTVVPGSDEALRMTIDDITRGQVVVSLLDKEGASVLASTSLKEGESAAFKFKDLPYVLTLRELNNELVGEDFARFEISGGESPSPALPARGRESEEKTEAVPASGRESEEVMERERGEITEREKIERLLSAIESAEGDVFIRNGAEHSAKDAAEHLRSKWQAAGDQVQTAEEFIDKIGTKSSLSGEAYRVRLANGNEIPASEYLREKLSGIENRRPAAQ